MSGIVLDIIVVAFIAVMGFLFKKKGFVMALFSFVSLLVSFIAAILLRPAIFAVVGVIGLVNSETSPVSLLVINLLIYFAVSLAVNAGLFFIGLFLNLFTKIPVVEQINALLGLILGLLLGILIVCIAFSIVGLADTWVNTEKILKIIENSYISEIFYKNNLYFLLQ